MLWGIDLGGTKIEGVVIDPDRPTEPVFRNRVPTESEQGYEHVVDQIARLVDWMERDTGLPRPPRIGFGTPGAFDAPTGGMRNCNSVVLNGRNLPADLERALGCGVVVQNDANCFALAEAAMGAAAGHPTVFGIIMGTGVGGGLVVDGRALPGLQGIAGEWGHNVLDPAGPPCYCGRRGCVETFLSGPATERYYESLTGSRRRLSEIAERHRSGTDPAATETVGRLCELFGRAVAVVVNIFDPHAIVIGGGVGNLDDLYTRGVAEATRHVFNPRLETPFLRPKLGDSAGVFGAAFLTA